jgi:outer membrane immunogenic protein
MKRYFLPACAVALMPFVQSVSTKAADLGAPIAPSVPYMEPMFNWTGFYIGANIGGGWAGGNIVDSLDGVSFGSGTHGAFIGGGQIGYNYQISPNIVLGAEWLMDGFASHNSSNIAFVPAFGDFFQASTTTDWLTTLTGRVGVTSPQWDHWLIYAKGGAAWVQNEATITDLATGASFNNTKISNGWVAGGGVEWAFAPGWTVRLEYQYIGLGGLSVADGQHHHGAGGGAGGGGAGGGGASGGGAGGGGAGGGGVGIVAPSIVSDKFNMNNTNVQTVTLGVNYLFNWSPAPTAPIVTKY